MKMNCQIARWGFVAGLSLLLASVSTIAAPAVFPLVDGELVVTTFPYGSCGIGSGYPMDPNGLCLRVYDTRVPPVGLNPVPIPGMNWPAPVYSDPSWIALNLGMIFGVELDDASPPNIYVSSTTVYGDFSGANECPTVPGGFGPDGAGAIYKIDGTSGAIQSFVITGAGGIGSNEIPNSGPGLGNFCFDKFHQQFFVTNHEDGRIYRIDMTGTLLSIFDPFDPDDGIPGFAPLGERLWGIGVYQDRLYFAVWLRDSGRPNTAWPAAAGPAPSSPNNSIWSVALDLTGDFSGSEQLEIVMPYLDPPTPHLQFSNPVSDIELSPGGKLLLAEHTMINDFGQIDAGHSARVLEYVGGRLNCPPASSSIGSARSLPSWASP